MSLELRKQEAEGNASESMFSETSRKCIRKYIHGGYRSNHYYDSLLK